MAGGCGVQLPKRQPALTRPAHSAQLEAKGEVSGLGISSPTTSSGSFLPGSDCALLLFRGSRTWELELAIYRRCRQAVRRREGWRDSSILEAWNSQLHDAHYQLPPCIPFIGNRTRPDVVHGGTAGLRDGMDGWMDGWITAGWLGCMVEVGVGPLVAGCMLLLLPLHDRSQGGRLGMALGCPGAALGCIDCPLSPAAALLCRQMGRVEAADPEPWPSQSRHALAPGKIWSPNRPESIQSRFFTDHLAAGVDSVPYFPTRPSCPCVARVCCR